MNSTQAEPPIVCTLDPAGLGDRMAEIAAFNARSLIGSRREGRLLTLSYEAGAIDEVRTMAAKERECCAFLSFDIDVRPDRVDLRIEAPAAAAESADELLAQFAATTIVPDSPKACGCVGACGPVEIPTSSSEKPVRAAALTASTAALACTACCVLPFVLPAAVLAATGGTIALFATAARWLVPIAAIAVIAGWWWVRREARRTGLQPSRGTKAMMNAATAMLLLSIAWPLIEPMALSLLKAQEEVAFAFGPPAPDCVILAPTSHEKLSPLP